MGGGEARRRGAAEEQRRTAASVFLPRAQPERGLVTTSGASHPASAWFSRRRTRSPASLAVGESSVILLTTHLHPY